MCVSEDESSSGPIYKDYAASVPVGPIQYEYMEAAPPPPMNYDDGPPVDSGPSQGSAPAMPAPAFNGPPVWADIAVYGRLLRCINKLEVNIPVRDVFAVFDLLQPLKGAFREKGYWIKSACDGKTLIFLSRALATDKRGQHDLFSKRCNKNFVMWYRVPVSAEYYTRTNPILIRLL